MDLDSNSNDEWGLFFKENEFGTAACFVDIENVPPKMPRPPTEPGPHVRESGRFIEQSVVDDFFMVATHTQKYIKRTFFPLTKPGMIILMLN